MLGSEGSKNPSYLPRGTRPCPADDLLEDLTPGPDLSGVDGPCEGVGVPGDIPPLLGLVPEGGAPLA